MINKAIILLVVPLLLVLTIACTLVAIWVMLYVGTPKILTLVLGVLAASGITVSIKLVTETIKYLKR